MLSNQDSSVLYNDVAVISTESPDLVSNTDKKKYYIESYGCQMNLSDSEIVASIMKNQGYENTETIENASFVFLNTCSIRDKAEQRIHHRLRQIKALKRDNKGMVVGILGCMAERMKSDLLKDGTVDIIAGPDSYRELPTLIQEVEGGQQAINVLLSRDETYADITPVRYSSNGITAFVTIMRGCDNMCAFCVVPFTRGRERSRPVESILNEVREASDRGYKEITLLGQNVDSYRYTTNEKLVGKKLFEHKYSDEVTNFSELLELVAREVPSLRVRFSTSHPKDMTDDVFHVMKKYDNICNYVHLPIQSGSSSCLERMNRTYDREWYLDRIKSLKTIIPDCAVSSDMISGFCGETEEEHLETLSLMKEVKFDASYMFYYSERPGTMAAKRYQDDIPLDVKKRRLQEIIDLQLKHSREKNQSLIGTIQTVLLEYTARKDADMLVGRTDSNKKVIVDQNNHKIGDYVQVKIVDANNLTLFGEVIN